MQSILVRLNHSILLENYRCTCQDLSNSNKGNIVVFSLSYQGVIQQLFDRWQQAQVQCHRMMIVLLGKERETITQHLFGSNSPLYSLLPPGDIITLGAENQEHCFHNLWLEHKHINLSWSLTKARLGGSEAALLIDLSEGFDPDALGASLGAISGQGLILVIGPKTPPKYGRLKEKLLVWPNDAQQVSEHFWNSLWGSFRDPLYFQQLHKHLWCSNLTDSSNNTRYNTTIQPRENSHSSKFNDKDTLQVIMSLELRQLISNSVLSIEQYQSILTIIFSHQRAAFTAVSLTANRGRGKSSVLGLSAASLLLLGEREVYITGPSEYACQAAFLRAHSLLTLAQSEPVLEGGQLYSKSGVLRFVSSQELWQRNIRPKTLFVDEAASFPVPFLERLLETKPHLIFATTTHGYEGTGRGFSLRFRPILQRKLRKLYEPKLTQALRWSPEDLVETWSKKVLHLESSLPKQIKNYKESEVLYKIINPNQDGLDSSIAEQVFNLLVNAHYRTQPSDFWRILDAPNINLHLLLYPQEKAHLPPLVLSAALVSCEGELSEEMAMQLYEGRIRPRGQLFAANLAVHLNSEQGSMMRLQRIVRIATQPFRQSNGLGTKLIEHIKAHAIKQKIDLLGSSFGATQQLVRFWFKADYIPLRVSVRQSHISGERSLLVVHPLSSLGQNFVDELLPEVHQDLKIQLHSSAQQMKAELSFIVVTTLVMHLKKRTNLQKIISPNLNSTSPLKPTKQSLLLTHHQWKALGAVAFSGRAYELVARSAKKLAWHWIEQQSDEVLTSLELTPLGRLLMMKIIQEQRWLEVTRDLQLGSTSEAMKGLSVILRLLYLDFAPSWALEWIKRFPQYTKPSTLSSALLPERLLKST